MLSLPQLRGAGASQRHAAAAQVKNGVVPATPELARAAEAALRGALEPMLDTGGPLCRASQASPRKCL